MMYRIGSLGEFSSYLQSNTNLSFIIVEGVSFTDLPLPSMDDATFIGCDFRPGTVMPDNLAGALFIDCRMNGLTFVKASLFAARFEHCDLAGSSFRECDLSATQFSGCRMGNVDFHDCDLDAAQMSTDTFALAETAPPDTAFVCAG